MELQTSIFIELLLPNTPNPCKQTFQQYQISNESPRLTPQFIQANISVNPLTPPPIQANISVSSNPRRSILDSLLQSLHKIRITLIPLLRFPTHQLHVFNPFLHPHMPRLHHLLQLPCIRLCKFPSSITITCMLLQNL